MAHGPIFSSFPYLVLYSSPSPASVPKFLDSLFLGPFPFLTQLFAVCPFLGSAGAGVASSMLSAPHTPALQIYDEGCLLIFVNLIQLDPSRKREPHLRKCPHHWPCAHACRDISGLRTDVEGPAHCGQCLPGQIVWAAVFSRALLQFLPGVPAMSYFYDGL